MATLLILLLRKSGQLDNQNLVLLSVFGGFILDGILVFSIMYSLNL